MAGPVLALAISHKDSFTEHQLRGLGYTEHPIRTSWALYSWLCQRELGLQQYVFYLAAACPNHMQQVLVVKVQVLRKVSVPGLQC
jgi:hypothetical protein